MEPWFNFMLMKTETTAANVTANFAGVAAIATAFSIIHLQTTAPSTKFNLVFQFDQSYCDIGGPLAPQGSGSDTNSVYASCNVDGINCLFSTTYAAATGSGAAACGFPETSVLSWATFHGVATADTNGIEDNPRACNDTTITPCLPEPNHCIEHKYGRIWI